MGLMLPMLLVLVAMAMFSLCQAYTMEYDEDGFPKPGTVLARIGATVEDLKLSDAVMDAKDCDTVFTLVRYGDVLASLCTGLQKPSQFDCKKAVIQHTALTPRTPDDAVCVLKQLLQDFARVLTVRFE